MLRSLNLLTRKTSHNFSTSSFAFFHTLKQQPYTREYLLEKIQHPKLFRLVNKLYRAMAIHGSGSTADAVRYELTTGIYLSKNNHLQKAIESRQVLTDLINSGSLNGADADIASSIRADLQDALTEDNWDKLYPGRQKLHR